MTPTPGRADHPPGRPFPLMNPTLAAAPMKTPTLAALVATLAAVDRHDAHGIRQALAALPYRHLEDDYKRDPEAACRAALRLTRPIRNPYRRLRAIDRLLGNHGEEHVYTHNGNHAFAYSNAGDSYAATVVLFPSGRFRVSSWGDIVERNPSRYA